jgi:hypothetical protein
MHVWIYDNTCLQRKKKRDDRPQDEYLLEKKFINFDTAIYESLTHGITFKVEEHKVCAKNQLQKFTSYRKYLNVSEEKRLCFTEGVQFTTLI